MKNANARKISDFFIKSAGLSEISRIFIDISTPSIISDIRHRALLPPAMYKTRTISSSSGMVLKRKIAIHRQFATPLRHRTKHSFYKRSISGDIFREDTWHWKV